MFGDDTIVVIENNNIGKSVLHVVNYDLESDILLYGNKGESGLRTTKKTKTIGASQLKVLIEHQILEVPDYKTIDELYNFVETGSSFEADSGKTDDLVMTLLNFAYITTTPYFKEFSESGANMRETFFEKKEQELMDDISPFGIISGGMGNSLDGIEDGYEVVDYH